MKWLKIISMMISLFAVLAFSQTADDFTVTDTEGNTHTLYTYLNDGKHVICSWMYTG